MTWRSEAACAGMDPAAFYTDDEDKARAAKAICADCPVRWDCLTDAIDQGEEYGIRGGMDPQARRKEARRRRLANGPRHGERAAVCDICGDPFHTVNPRQIRCGEIACRNRAERIRQNRQKEAAA